MAANCNRDLTRHTDFSQALTSEQRWLTCVTALRPLTRVRRAARRIRGRVALHKFRKTFATRFGEKVGITNARNLLGHADYD